MTHISYKCAKALKEFLGESAPEPMGDNPLAYYGKDLMHYVPAEKDTEMHRQIFNGFAYQLHDLLSKPFCEAMARRINEYRNDEKVLAVQARCDCEILAQKFYLGGLLAVEAELMKMMEGK